MAFSAVQASQLSNGSCAALDLLSGVDATDIDYVAGQNEQVASLARPQLRSFLTPPGDEQLYHGNLDLRCAAPVTRSLVREQHAKVEEAPMS